MQIPAITDNRLTELFDRIKPVVRNSSNALCYIKPCGLRDEAFTWDPKIKRKAAKLVKFGTIRTFHTFGYYGIFKPSIAEVLAQIPEQFLGEVVAFETIGPKDVHELNTEKEALNAGFHVAKTYLYARSA